MMRRIGMTVTLFVLAITAVGIFLSSNPSHAAEGHDEAHDPAYNVALPCEALATPGLAPRSAKNIVHIANVCGFVGTDIEFQSRTDADGIVHDFAFVGTMGAGTRIFDITDPAHPVQVGGYFDPGWQNDVQVRGDLLVVGFDWLLVGANLSTCLQGKNVENDSVTEAGVDLVRLHFDPETATFETGLIDCYRSSRPTGGAHTTTLHPSGEWLTINTAFDGIEIVDVRGSEPELLWWLDTELVGSAHDLSFSRDGNSMYVASPGTGTYIIDVSDVFNKKPERIAFIPQNTEPGEATNPYNLTTSHQADVSADGRVLVFTDERGGGLNNTDCNTDQNGVIGGMHFWALEPIEGYPETADASPSNPRRLGTWFYPNPPLAVDLLDPALASIGRTERGCTIHVFRNGGNGSVGPGEIAPGFGGVSSLPVHETVSAHYGAGVWHIDFSGPPAADGITEDARTDWGNTLGWNVMPGADTWTAKEYKGHVYAGDIARGFDVYRFADCSGIECVASLTSAPGAASGGGGTSGSLAELSILSGTSAGKQASFSFAVSFNTGDPVPTGNLTFIDHDLKKKVEATAIDTFSATATVATFTGRANVNGVPGVKFTVVVEDQGAPGDGTDSFRITLADGYGAGGELLNGNIEVESALLSNQ